MRGLGKLGLGVVVVALVALIGLGQPGAQRAGAQLAGNDWLKYGADNLGSGFTNETIISPVNAPTLVGEAGWPVYYASTISTQPVVANGLVYIGTWDGNEHAIPLAGGADKWTTNIGKTIDPNCGSTGVTSTPDYVNVTVPNKSGTVPYLFVGGGGTTTFGGGSSQLFALDPTYGTILWHTPVGPSPSYFSWASPADYTYTVGTQKQTSVYTGISSNCDLPLIRGGLAQFDAATGAIQHVFYTVPAGCVGASIWGSPTIDPSDGSIYVATGNAGPCSTTETYAVAVLKLRASDLTLLDHWSVPAAEQVGGNVNGDGDYGSTPTLFTGTVHPGGTQQNLLGVGNKNGVYYVFNRSNLPGSGLSAGPVAKLKLSLPSDQNGGIIAPSSWDGSQLYVAAIKPKLSGITFSSALYAFNPNDFSQPVWLDTYSDGAIYASVTSAPGLVVIGEGPYTVVVRSDTGTQLFKKEVGVPIGKTPPTFIGAPSIAHGVIYEGDASGHVYAYAPPVNPPPPPPPPPPPSP